MKKGEESCVAGWDGFFGRAWRKQDNPVGLYSAEKAQAVYLLDQAENNLIRRDT